mgnify:FL=1
MPQFTKNAIKNSFLKLLNEMPLNKISVRVIAEDCGINRNTFYYHFTDIPALIEEIVMESVNALIEEYPTIDSLEQCFSAVFKFALKNKKAAAHIFNSVNRDIYERNLMRYCEYIVKTYLDRIFGGSGVSELDNRIAVKIFKCMLFGACIDWVERGMPEDYLNDLPHVMSVFKGMPEEVLRRMSADNRQA